MYGFPEGHPRSVTKLYKAARGFNTQFTTDALSWYPLEIPSGFTMMRAVLIGGGGGGGSGFANSNPTPVASGGGGGAGGAYVEMTTPIAALQPGLIVVVGHGGLGGPDNPSGTGSAGGIGGYSYIGPRVTDVESTIRASAYIWAPGGDNGSGGSTGSGGNGANNTEDQSFAWYGGMGGDGGSGNDAPAGATSGDNLPTTLSINEPDRGGSGGGGGLGRDATGAASTGPAGSGGSHYNVPGGVGGNVGVPPTRGVNCYDRFYFGPGTGGGGAYLGQVGADGGEYGGGGGGGAGGSTADHGQAGGNGGHGAVLLTFY